jgi:hypothetical protein
MVGSNFFCSVPLLAGNGARRSRDATPATGKTLRPVERAERLWPWVAKPLVSGHCRHQATFSSLTVAAQALGFDTGLAGQLCGRLGPHAAPGNEAG